MYHVTPVRVFFFFRERTHRMQCVVVRVYLRISLERAPPLWLFLKGYVESNMCSVLLRFCLSTGDCAENRRLAKVSEKE